MRIGGAGLAAAVGALAAVLLALGAGTPRAGAQFEAWASRLARLEALWHARQGHRCLIRGDAGRAARSYQAALAADRTFVEPWFLLGYAYERQALAIGAGDPRRERALRRAVVALSAAARARPGLDRRALIRLAALHSPAGLDEPRELEHDLSALVALGAPEADWFLSLSRLREDAGREGEAEAALLAGRAALPGEPALHRELARFYRRHRRLDDSLAALEVQLREEPDDREALFGVAEGCFYSAFRDHRLEPARRRARVQRGLAAAGRLLRLEPDHAAGRLYLKLLAGLRDADPEEGA